MCGIFAMFLSRPLTEADIAAARAATAQLRHRGPDAQGEWVDRANGVFLGHTRLSIIDLTSSSAQPMHKAGCALSYNGELYNYRALREQLGQLGEVFESKGDVEVFLRAWRRWGPDALNRFDGMFASALWDGEAGHLVVDAFGEKPLLWAETKDGVYVSSEMSVLADLVRPQPQDDPEAWAAFYSLGYFPAPTTGYRGVHRLAPASRLKILQGRACAAIRYWTAPRATPVRGPVRPVSEEQIGQLQRALSESTAGRLEADVPVGLFLSGGVDSSLVACLASRDLGVRVDALTMEFPQASVQDEAPAAARIAAALGLSHQVLRCNDAPELFGPAALLDLYGEPSEFVTVFSLLQLSAAVAQTYKVALTGFGGDEVTWGYGKHAHFYQRRRWFRAPARLRRLLGRGAAPLGAMGRNFAATVGVEDWEIYLAQKNGGAVDWLRQLPGFTNWARRATNPAGEPIEYWVPRFELLDVMPGQHLVGTDLGSMRHGLELRTPFLSRQVLETVATFDPRALIAFGQKSVLRRLLARYLPPELTDQPKTGFTFPLDRFLAGTPPGTAPGTRPGAVDSAWRHRFDSNARGRIAVRVLEAGMFLERCMARDASRVAFGGAQ